MALFLLTANNNLTITSKADTTTEEGTSTSNQAIIDNTILENDPTGTLKPYVADGVLHALAELLVTNQHEVTNVTQSTDFNSLGSVINVDVFHGTGRMSLVCSYHNIDNKNQNGGAAIFLLPNSFSNSPDVTLPEDYDIKSLLKQLPKDVDVQLDVKGEPNYLSIDDAKKSPNFSWLQVKSLRFFYSDKEVLKPGDGYTVQVPLIVHTYDPVTVGGIFRIGVYIDANTQVTYPFRIAQLKMVGNSQGQYQAMLLKNGKLGHASDDIQKLMPQVNPKDVKFYDFYRATEIPDKNLYSGGFIIVNYSNTHMIDKLKTLGYSLALDANHQPYKEYSSQINYDTRFPARIGQFDNGTAPYTFMVLRQVLQTKDSTIQVGDKWQPVDNFVSGLDDNDQPLQFKDVGWTVDDKAGILINNQAMHDGKFQVTYSYQVSDDYYDRKTPYIITRTANVIVNNKPEPKPVQKPAQKPAPKPVQKPILKPIPKPEPKPNTNPAPAHHSHNELTTTNHSTDSNQPINQAPKKPDVIKYADHLVSTYPQKGVAKLYYTNGNVEKNRGLAAGTDWFSDQEKLSQSQEYYRVSTNEWVNANDVYLYQNDKQIVQIGDESQQMTSSEGQIDSKQELRQHSSWKTDRIAIINGKKEYRVSTDEFIPDQNS